MEISAYEFGLEVRLLRGRRGFTQRELAEHSGLKRAHLSALEQGRVNPSLRTIVAIARGLGLGVSTLFIEIEKRLLSG